MRRWAQVPTPVGPLTVIVGDDGVESIGFDAPPPDDGVADHSLEAAEQLRAWLRGERRRFDLPLAPAGTPFQNQVWAALRDVPYGQTTSYGALAKQLGKPPGASRAIGAANGANPLVIVVPCHRVLGSDGSLTSYVAGVERKRWLLAHEAGAPGLPFACRAEPARSRRGSGERTSPAPWEEMRSQRDTTLDELLQTGPVAGRAR